MMQPAECPMCSWVYKRAAPPDTFASFSPKKQQKGIIYYHERIAEMEMASPDCASKIIDVKVEESVVVPVEPEPATRTTRGRRRGQSYSVDNSMTDDKPSFARKRKKRRE